MLYNGLFACSGSWGPFGGWCNAQTQSSVGHWFKSSMGHFFLSDGFFLYFVILEQNKEGLKIPLLKDPYGMAIKKA